MLLLAVLLPAVVAFGILYRQALTVPYLDDYNAVLAFAIDYEQSPKFEAKLLEIVTKQHNEYKRSFANSVVAAELEFTHHLNFTFLTVLGDLFLLPIGFLLWKTYQGSERDRSCRLLEFLPVSLLFFSLSYWENLNWAMTGLQNTPVILFSFLAIYLLAGRDFPARGVRFLFACLVAVVATFTSANGFLLGPVGVLMLLPRRAYSRSLGWCASFILALIPYLYHYTHYTPATFITGNGLFLSRVLSFLAFFGGVIPNRWVAALLGLVILAILLVAIGSRFDRANPTAFYFTVWVVATGGVVSWVRGAMAFQTVSRYSIYSCLVLIFCYSFLAWYLPQRSPNFHRRRFYVSSVVAAVAFCFFTDLDANRNLEARRRMALTGIENYRADPKNNSPMNAPLLPSLVLKEKEFEREVLTQSIQTGIYTLPPRQ